MSNKIIFPALFINPKTSDINAIKKKQMVADIRLLNDKKNIKKYQKNVIIVDSTGNKYNQIKKKAISGISIWLSIYYAGKIVRVESVVEDEVGKISLFDLKTMIIEIIKEKPKKWLPLGPIGVIEEFLEEAKTYKEVMKIFNTSIR